jgi:pyruvate/2-oxoglutarate dehydrogenase complex dihydrolipoamide acyltransferase (E2) component
LNAGYHHLSNWGTTSVFVVIGEKERRPVFHEDGTFEMRTMLDVGITLDERIADGYYYAKTVRLLKKLIENPELLDRPANEEVDY